VTGADNRPRVHIVSPLVLRTIFAAILLALPLFSAHGRTWTDASGQNRLDAELVDVNSEGRVFLNTGRPANVEIDLKELSAADQQYVRDELQRRRKTLEAELSDKPGLVQYGEPRKLAELANPAITESSGIACSRVHPGVFWTHNDAGHEGRLYAFDLKGRDLGSCLLAGIDAFDWEDIASFTMDGKNYLLVGDIGNNGLHADVQLLYLVEEPPLDPATGVKVKQVPVVQTINVAYEDRLRNCEALALDVTTRTVLIISKEKTPACVVYALPWPKNDPQKVFTAKKIATLKVPLVTAMDVSPDGRRAIVGTYRHAYEFSRAANETWDTAFSRKPVEVVLPVRRQGEGICYGPDGKTLYLTSEKRPTPLWEVPVQ
jgi:hypothetical protein